MNSVTMIGNLGREPEMRYSSSGTAITSFSIAMNERYISNGEQKERTEWANIVTFGRLAEACADLGKGQQVCVQGRMQTRSWEGQDGKKQYRTEVVADGVFRAVGTGAREETSNADTSFDDDDLPF